MAEEKLSPIILLEDEPLDSVLCTFLGWLGTMCVLVLLLIYFSDYFGRATECFIPERKGVKEFDDRLARWKSGFMKRDHPSYVWF